jgi:hypothetical protein
MDQTDPLSILHSLWNKNPRLATEYFFNLQIEEYKFFFCDKLDALPRERTARLEVLSDLATIFAGDKNYKADYNKVSYLIKEVLKTPR